MLDTRRCTPSKCSMSRAGMCRPITSRPTICKAYARIRKHCPAQSVAVVFHDGFRDFQEYLGFMQAPQYRNVLFDIHRYQCFERSDIDLDAYGHLHKAAGAWKGEADAIINELPTLCGEWSLGLDLKVVSLWAEGPFNCAPWSTWTSSRKMWPTVVTRRRSWQPSRNTRAGSSGNQAKRPRRPRPGVFASVSSVAGCRQCLRSWHCSVEQTSRRGSLRRLRISLRE